MIHYVTPPQARQRNPAFAEAVDEWAAGKARAMFPVLCGNRKENRTGNRKGVGHRAVGKMHETSTGYLLQAHEYKIGVMERKPRGHPQMFFWRFDEIAAELDAAVLGNDEALRLYCARCAMDWGYSSSELLLAACDPKTVMVFINTTTVNGRDRRGTLVRVYRDGEQGLVSVGQRRRERLAVADRYRRGVSDGTATRPNV